MSGLARVLRKRCAGDEPHAVPSVGPARECAIAAVALAVPDTDEPDGRTGFSLSLLRGDVRDRNLVVRALGRVEPSLDPRLRKACGFGSCGPAYFALPSHDVAASKTAPRTLAASPRTLSVMVTFPDSLSSSCPWWRLMNDADSGWRRLTLFPDVAPGGLTCQRCVAAAFPRPSSVT